MTAFNVVRFKVKPGMEEAFLDAHRNIAESWLGMRHANMESIYEYGSRAGFWRLWRMFTSRRVPVTVYGVATALGRNPDAVAAACHSSP